MKKTFYKLRAQDHIVTLIKGLHPHLKKKVRLALQEIISNPYTGKVLKDELEGLRSFRVSRFRIIYMISKRKQIEIVAIGPRKDIYVETLKILRK